MMLEVDNLSAGYGRIPILNNVTFSVAAGEFIGVLGHNGMGKTTLLRTLMGYLPATSGRVTFEGADLTRAEPYVRARAGIGLVPQGREIFPRLTVLENLKTGLAAAKGAKTIPDEIFELFPVLDKMLHRRGGDLSGGQQQQLSIARALVTRPTCLVLDEPTEGIQPSIIKDIGRVITLLAQRGDMAILLVEQYLDFARELADRFSVMERGEVVISGNRGELDDQAVQRYLAV